MGILNRENTIYHVHRKRCITLKKIAACLVFIIFCFPVLTVSAGIFDWPNISPTNTSEISLNITNSPYPFSADELEKRLNIPTGSLKGITVTKLPNESEGSLMLNGESVSAYQQISRDALQYLTFVPAKEAAGASLSILPQVKDAVQTVISLRVQSDDVTPIAVLSKEYETFSEVPIYGYLSVSNESERYLRTVLIEKPQKGTVSFDGQTFCYEPFPGSEGNDHFTVVLTDDTGNRSEEAVQTISIEPKDLMYDYWDLNDSPAYYSAVKLLQNDIFAGEVIGSRRYFHPEQTVTRGEFLMLLVSACGWEDELSATSPNTGLLNDGEIPTYLKPYLALCIRKGVIVEDRFDSDEIPTCAEAVVLTDRACKLSNVERANPGWSDLGEIPQWALQSYMNLHAYDFLSFPDNKTHPNDGLTRENTAELLWQCRKYITKSNFK